MMINEIRRMQQLAGIKLNELDLNNPNYNFKDLRVSWNQDAKTDPVIAVARTITEWVREYEDYNDGEGNVQEATQTLIDINPENDDGDFFGTVESNLKAFKEFPSTFKITNNIDGDFDETFDFIKTGENSFKLNKYDDKRNT